MAELFKAVASWPTLLLVLLVFGFAPGFVLRLLVLAYPRSAPRRRELVAELYTVPRIQRPLWVTEQLEVALFEGLAQRVSATIHSHTRRRRARAQTDIRGGWIQECRYDFTNLLMGVLTGGLAGGLTGGLAGGLVYGLVSGLAFGLEGGFVVGVSFGSGTGLTVLLTSVLMFGLGGGFAEVLPQTARPRLDAQTHPRFRA